MKVKNAIKKVGAAAASTLMVGMTMGSAATLADYPGLFLDDDGTPTAQIVVGTGGAVTDVVSAVNVGASLGQATVQTEEVTEEVDASVSGTTVGWSASDGQTLDTSNDNLYFGEDIDEARQTLTQEHLDALQSTTFQDDEGNSQEVEHYLYLNEQAVTFGHPGDTGDEDPQLYVNNPAETGDLTGGLYSLQANFEDGLEFLNDAGDGINEAVVGEEIDLFGKTFTIGEGSFDDNDGELVLYGSSEEYDLETGQSTDFTINGESHTLEVRAVTDSSTVAFYVDGELRERTEGNSFNVGGTDIRVSSVIQTSSQNSEGLATFSIGSEEYVMQDGEPVEDADGDEITGTHVEFSGDNVAGNAGDGDDVVIDSIEVGVSAADSDTSFVGVDEEFEDPLFEGINFHFGGLAPDASETGDSVSSVEFTPDDEVASVSFEDGEESATIDFYNEDNQALQDEDGANNDFVLVEGAAVEEDQYFLSDAGDFDHLWEVTGVDADTTSGSNDIVSDDQATVELRDVVSGSDIEVTLDAYADDDSFGDAGDQYYRGEEVIDGQTYHFAVDAAAEDVYVAWDSNADFTGDDADGDAAATSLLLGDQVSVAPTVDTTSGAAVGFFDVATLDQNIEGADPGVTLELPSSDSSDAKTVTLSHTQQADTGQGDTVEVTTSEGASGTFTEDGGTGNTAHLAVTVGQVDYQIEVSGLDYDAAGSNDVVVENVELVSDQTTNAATATDTGGAATEPSAMVLQPEDDGDNEQGYIVTPDDDGEDNVEILEDDVAYTGGAFDTYTLEESDEDMNVWYNGYGSYGMVDTEDEGSFTLNVPHQQAVAGAAFTGASGSLDQSGAASGTAEVTYTGVTNADMVGTMPDLAMTDDQVSQSDRDSDMILVGGPAVNSLVQELASDGQTWTADEWSENHQDEALLQLVEDAFGDGNHAMIVAGWGASDTSAAARYLANYADHQDALADAGENGRTLSLTQSMYPGQ